MYKRQVFYDTKVLFMTKYENVNHAVSILRIELTYCALLYSTRHKAFLLVKFNSND